MRYIIDRIEGNTAVCEDENGNFIEIDILSLPSNIKEGDCIKFENLKYILDEKYTEERRKNIRNKMNNLWK